LLESAFGFFTRVLNVVKGDLRLAILWGFGVLLLVVLIVALVLAGDLTPLMKLGVVVLIVLVLAYLFVHTVPKLAGPEEPPSGSSSGAGRIVLLLFALLAVLTVAGTLLVRADVPEPIRRAASQNPPGPSGTPSLTTNQ
jgi:hypothetical protein